MSRRPPPSPHALAPRALAPLALALLLAGCGGDATPPGSTGSANADAGAPPAAAEREPDERGPDEADPLLAAAGVPHVRVAEAWLSPMTPDDNIDSPATWTSPEGATWVIATAKATDGVVVYDAATGAELRRMLDRGKDEGEFKRPNGIAVLGDHAFVVERDNQRVQVLRLPGLESVGSFGAGELVQPYGLWVRELAPGQLEVSVSDAYMAGEDADGEDLTPPLAELGRRFKRYAVSFDADGRVVATHAGDFGDTTEAGAIRIPESLWGDVAHDRLLVSEEDTATGTAVREYALDGTYRGRTIGLGLFQAQAEGLALWACPDGSGYWIATDQFKDASLFHVFDRESLAHLGAFAGHTVANTDGVWLHQAATARFPAGAFYAVHDDQGVGAFDWRDVAAALSLRVDCAAAPAAASTTP